MFHTAEMFNPVLLKHHCKLYVYSMYTFNVAIIHYCIRCPILPYLNPTTTLLISAIMSTYITISLFVTTQAYSYQPLLRNYSIRTHSHHLLTCKTILTPLPTIILALHQPRVWYDKWGNIEVEFGYGSYIFIYRHLNILAILLGQYPHTQNRSGCSN